MLFRSDTLAGDALAARIAGNVALMSRLAATIGARARSACPDLDVTALGSGGERALLFAEAA